MTQTPFEFPDDHPGPPIGMVPPAQVRDGVVERLDATVSLVPGYRPLMLDFYRPVDREGQVLPLVIWVHGGAWLFGSPKENPEFLVASRLFQRVLESGYALARVTYRLSAEATFPAQICDVKAAVRWLRQNAAALGVDPRAFAAWGESAGGHLSSMIALTGVPDCGWEGASEADGVQAAVIWYGPSDLASMQSQALPTAFDDHDAPGSPESRLIGAPVNQAADLALQASPISYVTAGAPPMRLIHGLADRVVPSAQSQELFDALTAVGAPVELSLVPDADHCFDGVDLTPIVDDSLEFLAHTIGSGH